MITYHEPTESQIQIVKRLFEFQKQINNAESISEIQEIIPEIYRAIQPVPTATYTLHTGITKDFSAVKGDFSQVLIAEINTYTDVINMKVGVILTLDLIMSAFVVGKKKQIEILNTF